MNKEDRYYFFIDDVCRSLYATFDEEVKLKGVPAWKTSVPAEIFFSPEISEDNACYCIKDDSPICQHSGAIGISSCQSGAPVVVSSAHFLYGDGFYIDMVEGVSPPIREEHEAALVFEPNTGAAIKVDKRLQINMQMKRDDVVDAFKNIDDFLVFPILWLNESATLSQSDADDLIMLLVTPELVVFILQIVLCILGGVMFVSPMIYSMKSNKKSKHQEKMHMGSTNNAYAKDTHSQKM